MCPSPAGIPDNIDIGRPEGQSFINDTVRFAAGNLVFDAPLLTDDLPDPADQVLVKGGRQTDRLREHGCQSGPGDPVKGFVPPIVGRDAEAFYGR